MTEKELPTTQEIVKLKTKTKAANFVQFNMRAFCLRLPQYGLLKCHRGIFCVRPVFWSWMTYIGCYVLQTCSFQRYQSTEVFLRWKWVYCSLTIALERTVFPLVKQYIEDRQDGGWMFLRPNISCTFFEQEEKVTSSSRYLIFLNSITLKSNLIVSGILWLIKCPFCRETVKLMINETKNTSANEKCFDEGCEKSPSEVILAFFTGTSSLTNKIHAL